MSILGKRMRTGIIKSPCALENIRSDRVTFSTDVARFDADSKDDYNRKTISGLTKFFADGNEYDWPIYQLHVQNRNNRKRFIVTSLVVTTDAVMRDTPMTVTLAIRRHVLVARMKAPFPVATIVLVSKEGRVLFDLGFAYADKLGNASVTVQIPRMFASPTLRYTMAVVGPDRLPLMSTPSFTVD